MAIVNFGTFKSRVSSRVPKLMLDKDEQVRACFIEREPRLVYVHNFEKVVVGDDGKAIVEHDTWPDGKPREKAKTDYAGKFRCLGNEDEIQRSGADPENCPACRAGIEYPNAVKAPVMRIIGHVLKYNTKPGTFTPTKPFQAELLAWDLTAKRFEALQDLFNEHGPLDQKDLLLGPCENKQMQKYNINIGNGTANYLESDATKQYVVELLRENRIEDLEGVAGKRPSEFEMETKVNEVVRAYKHAYGLGTGDNYQSLLGSGGVLDAAAQGDVAEEPTPTFQAKAEPQTASAPQVEVEDTVVEEVASDDATPSLEDLLRGIG